jgi:PAS domain-containing protein
VILRVVLGHFAAGLDARALFDLRGRLSRAAQAVDGLESLVVGARHMADATSPGDGAEAPIASDQPPIQAAIVTVWRDVDAMARATAVAEEERFIGGRLELAFKVERTDHFEIVGRVFAALPPAAIALLRIMSVSAGPTDEAVLVDTLRSQQPRLVDLGLVASLLGRRIRDDGTVEAVHVSVWPDRATIRAATRGAPELPLFAAELQAWRERITLEQFDGVEIVPRLPSASGPPLLILDDDARIVDITAAPSAMLGMTQEDLVGRSVDTLVASEGGRGEDWTTLVRRGSHSGDARWSVPEVGQIMVRFVARRDAPVPGRHAVLVRRHAEAAPTAADLDEALAMSFQVT